MTAQGGGGLDETAFPALGSRSEGGGGGGGGEHPWASAPPAPAIGVVVGGGGSEARVRKSRVQGGGWAERQKYM